MRSVFRSARNGYLDWRWKLAFLCLDCAHLHDVLWHAWGESRFSVRFKYPTCFSHPFTTTSRTRIDGFPFRTRMRSPIIFLRDGWWSGHPHGRGDHPTRFFSPLAQSRECPFFPDQCWAAVSASDDWKIHL